MTFNIVSSIQSQVTGGVNPTDFSFADITNNVVSGLASTNWSLGQYNGNALSINSPCAMSKTGQYIIIGGYSSSTSIPYYISVSSNYGQTWTRSNFFSPNTTNYASVTGVAISGNGEYMYAASNNDSYVRRSINYGVSWDYSYNTGNFGSSDVACSYNGKYVLVACSIYNAASYSMSCDYGLTFSGGFLAGAQRMNCCAISNDGYTAFISRSQYIYKTTQAHIGDVPNTGGGVYSLIYTTPDSSTVSCLCMSSNKNMIIFGTSASNGTLYISKDGGSSWTTKVVGSGNATFCSMSYDGKQILVVFGSSSNIYYSKNGTASSVADITFTQITSLQNFPTITGASWAGSAVSGDGSRSIFISNTTIGTNTQKLAYLSDNVSQ